MERIKEAVMRARMKRAEQEAGETADAPSGQTTNAPVPAGAQGQSPQSLPAAQENAVDQRGGDVVAQGTASVATATGAAIPADAQGTGGALATAEGAIAQGAVAEGVGALTPVSSIKYKQTRVVQLDPKHLEQNRIISFSKSDARTVSFDRLRTQVLRTMRDYGWRTLAVTSPTASCGKTTVAINLALSIAHQTEQTVVLADFDLRDPQMADYLGLPESVSLVDYLNGNAPLSDVFVNPGIPRLTLLPNHKAILNAAETLMTKKMSDLVSDIRNRYESRLVIFDLPALLTTDDALAFLPLVDCVLLVVAGGQSSKLEVKESMRLIQNTELLGTVLNKADEMRSAGT